MSDNEDFMQDSSPDPDNDEQSESSPSDNSEKTDILSKKVVGTTNAGEISEPVKAASDIKSSTTLGSRVSNENPSNDQAPATLSGTTAPVPTPVLSETLRDTQTTRAPKRRLSSPESDSELQSDSKRRVVPQSSKPEDEESEQEDEESERVIFTDLDSIPTYVWLFPYQHAYSWLKTNYKPEDWVKDIFSDEEIDENLQAEIRIRIHKRLTEQNNSKNSNMPSISRQIDDPRLSQDSTKQIHQKSGTSTPPKKRRYQYSGENSELQSESKKHSSCNDQDKKTKKVIITTESFPWAKDIFTPESFERAFVRVEGSKNSGNIVRGTNKKDTRHLPHRSESRSQSSTSRSPVKQTCVVPPNVRSSPQKTCSKEQRDSQQLSSLPKQDETTEKKKASTTRPASRAAFVRNRKAGESSGLQRNSARQETSDGLSTINAYIEKRSRFKRTKSYKNKKPGPIYNCTKGYLMDRKEHLDPLNFKNLMLRLDLIHSYISWFIERRGAFEETLGRLETICQPSPLPVENSESRNTLPGSSNSLPGSSNSLPGSSNSLPGSSNSLPEGGNSLPEGGNSLPEGGNTLPRRSDKLPKHRNTPSQRREEARNYHRQLMEHSGNIEVYRSVLDGMGDMIRELQDALSEGLLRFNMSDDILKFLREIYENLQSIADNRRPSQEYPSLAQTMIMQLNDEIVNFFKNFDDLLDSFDDFYFP